MNYRVSLVAQGKECACIAGDSGRIAGWGRAPGEGNGYPFLPENSMDGGAYKQKCIVAASGNLP